MAKPRAIRFLAGVCALLCLGAASTSELAPVFMWETANTNEIIPATGHINKATFQEILLQLVEKSNPFIVVYAENNLSPEDFIEQDREIFRHLSKLSDRNQVSYMPLVESPVETIKELPAKIAEVSIEELLTNNIPDAKVLIVNLNDAREDENRIDMLRRHDAIIVKSYNDLLEQHENMLAIFTGYHSSWIVPEDIKNHRVARSTNEVAQPKADPERQVVSLDGFLFYLSHYVQVTKGKDVKIYNINGGSANNGSVTLTSNGTDIILELESILGYWYLKSITHDSVTTTTKIYAPEGFSYHCGDTTFNLNETSIKFRGLQLQYAGTNQTELTKFSDTYDCVGFTTAPIWSGLFITFILVLIMTLGLTMMMDIKTMDRFDDPKGKTIIINASE